MRSYLFSLILIGSLFVAVGVMPARAQATQGTATASQPPQEEDGEDAVRGAFLTTRPAPLTSAAPERRQAPVAPVARKSDAANQQIAAKQAPRRATNARAANNSAGVNKGVVSVAKNTDAGKTNKARRVEMTGGTAAVAIPANFVPDAHNIGLGYTLYLKDENGGGRRVDPARRFASGEAIRIALETNTDGYLYVFHTENEGPPEMIFPDARLVNGDNAVRAHVPYEVPSNVEGDERFRWYVFDKNPASERLFIVVTRQPLPGVPTGEFLTGYCAAATERPCVWRPTPTQWATFRDTHEHEQVAVSRAKDEGMPQTEIERDAVTRGLGLGHGTPAPSVVRMTATGNATALITTIDLIHK